MMRIRGPVLAVCCSAMLFLSGCGDDKKSSGDMDMADSDMINVDLFPDGGMDMRPDGDVLPDSDMPPSDADMGDMTMGPVVVCDTQLPTPSSGLCEVIQGGSTDVAIQGVILAGSQIYENGTVVITGQGENKTISCVGCDCDTTGATIVACPEGVVSPGLINGHDHTTFSMSLPLSHTEDYEHRHDWRCGVRGHTRLRRTHGGDNSREGILFGELRMLFGGATSVAGSVEGQANDARGLLRNLDAPTATGGLVGVDVEYETFPLGDDSSQASQCINNLNASGCSYPDIFSASRAAAADIFLPHIGEGVDDEAHNEFLCLSTMMGADVLGSNTSIVHGMALTLDDVNVMAAERAKLVWSARTNIDLYANTAQVTMFKNRGVTIALGTDWSTSGSMNMLRELKCIDELNQNQYDATFSDYELWSMATYNGAVAMGAEDQIGLLREGYVADIAVFDGRSNSEYRAVIDAAPQDVALVMRGGTPLYGDTNIVDGVLGPQSQGCEPVSTDDMGATDVCGVSKKVCAQLDTGMTLQAIRGALDSDAYGLLYCGVPPGEPSCVPDRPGEYSGISSNEDIDGDGIPNGMDNCARIFNPIRPMDNGVQPDTDQDLIGDVCDPCPLDQNNTCSPVTPGDIDQDTIEDVDDNCPSEPNMGQEDTDMDGLGDACDLCPTVPNPGGTACPVSIYDVKNGVVPVGSPVRIENALVTGSKPGTGFFVQVHPNDTGYAGAPFSGLYIHSLGTMPSPQRGDRVTIDGGVEDYFGQIQVSDVTGITIESTGNMMPPPTIVSSAAVADNGAERNDYEGVLITVENVTVLEVEPPPGQGEGSPTNAFIVTGGLRVDDFFYTQSPLPAVTDGFTALTGILRWAHQHSKLEPRDINDLGPPGLLAFTNADVTLAAGTTGPTSPTLEVRLSATVSTDTTVMLNIGPAGTVTGPSSVTVLAGTSSVPLTLTGVAANAVPGTVTATYDGAMTVASVRVYDDMSPRTVTSFTPSPVTISTGTMATMTVTLDLPGASMGTPVALTYGGEVSGPSSATVPAGAFSVDVMVTGSMTPGAGTITAQAAGAGVTVNATVTDSPPLGFVIAEVFYDYRSTTSSDDDMLEWIKIYNGTSGTINLTGYSLGWGGADYLWGQINLTGSLPAGGCFVVGGPNSDADNGNPVFDIAADLASDIQNSGSAGDGVALFDSPTHMVNASTVPIDAIIYGPNNNNGLIDETGMANAPEVGDAPSGSSIRLKADGTWEINAAPSPSLCPPI